MKLVFWPVSTWDPSLVAALRRHYSESRGAPPGKKLAWAILEDGTRVGHVAIGEPAFKLAPRRRLGLLDARPAPGTVSCWFFRVEGHRTPASRILRAWLPIASAAWERAAGWGPEHWETLVGTHLTGACFLGARFRAVGLTTGRTARRPAGASRGPRVWADSKPRMLLYKGPLVRLPVTKVNP